MDANEALEQFKAAMATATKTAQEHLDRGVHPDGMALRLADITDALPVEAQVAQIVAQFDQLPPEVRKRLRAELDALIEAKDDSNPPEPAPPT